MMFNLSMCIYRFISEEKIGVNLLAAAYTMNMFKNNFSPKLHDDLPHLFVLLE